MTRNDFNLRKNEIMLNDSIRTAIEKQTKAEMVDADYILITNKQTEVTEQIIKWNEQAKKKGKSNKQLKWLLEKWLDVLNIFNYYKGKMFFYATEVKVMEKLCYDLRKENDELKKELETLKKNLDI